MNPRPKRILIDAAAASRLLAGTLTTVSIVSLRDKPCAYNCNDPVYLYKIMPILVTSWYAHYALSHTAPSCRPRGMFRFTSITQATPRKITPEFEARVGVQASDLQGWTLTLRRVYDTPAPTDDAQRSLL